MDADKIRSLNEAAQTAFAAVESRVQSIHKDLHRHIFSEMRRVEDAGEQRFREVVAHIGELSKSMGKIQHLLERIVDWQTNCPGTPTIGVTARTPQSPTSPDPPEI